MNNRNEIKWQPFNAVTSSNQILKELQQKRLSLKLPILSPDEIEQIENIIKKAFHTHEKVKLIYFYQNKYYIKSGIITQLNPLNNKLYFQDNTSLFFDQIIKIKFLNNSF